MNILDYSDDVNKVLLDVGAMGLPPFVDLEKVAEDTPSTDAGYALPLRGKFPINTKANTWLSIHYFEKTAESLSGAERKEAFHRLRDASHAWGLTAPKEWTGHVKEASDPDDKGLWTIKTEMEKFADNAKFIDFNQRRAIAKTIVKEASALGVAVPNLSLINYASDIPADDMDARLVPRKFFLDPEDQKKLDTIANAKGKVPIDYLIKALADLDERLGLKSLYDKQIKDPVITLTQTTESKKEPPLIEIGELKVRPDDLQDTLDPDMIQKLQVDPQKVLAKNPTLLDVIKKVSGK